MDEILLTPQEVADVLKIKKNTVYELIKRGELKCNKIGKQFRISRSQLDEYLNLSDSVEPQEAKGSTGDGSGFTASNSISINGNNQDYPMGIRENETFHGNKISDNKYNDTRQSLNKGIVICGQDMILDLLSNHLEHSFDDFTFLRSYQGSYNGLYSLYQDKVQIATVHLWDHITGEYNNEFVRRMLPGTRYIRIHLIKRMQGFYVKEGNPKGISDFKDLTRDDINMINREKGSGTRILLDEHLIRLNINHKWIKGYDKEVTSHIAGASAVARGQVDVSMGNENTVKQVKGVDFIPIQMESVDIIVKEELVDQPWCKAMIDILKSKDFKDEVTTISNYDVEGMGEIY